LTKTHDSAATASGFDLSAILFYINVIQYPLGFWSYRVFIMDIKKRLWLLSASASWLEKSTHENPKSSAKQRRELGKDHTVLISNINAKKLAAIY
jgi:hypothetical protein